MIMQSGFSSFSSKRKQFLVLEDQFKLKVKQKFWIKKIYVWIFFLLHKKIVVLILKNFWLKSMLYFYSCVSFSQLGSLQYNSFLAHSLHNVCGVPQSPHNLTMCVWVLHWTHRILGLMVFIWFEVEAIKFISFALVDAVVISTCEELLIFMFFWV